MSIEETIIRIIKNAKRPVVLTGAGVSKESGIPTFRDAMDGLWAQYDPQQLATPRAFAQNPKLVWDWYEYRRGLVNHAKPNAGHITLAQMEKLYPKMWIITQNVDNLHEQAGSTRIIRLHGNIAETVCYNHCRGERIPIDKADFVWDADQSTPPRCPHCGGYLRPNVVWFEENLPAKAMQDAFNVATRCDVMLVVGTSGIVSPASDLPHVALHNGAALIEINPEESALTRYMDAHLKGASGVVLPSLLGMIS
ncbi:MAG: NAD-dependent deacylase [Anaerolineae bacterium]|nr:NAD-dependent deacylase [Anaerolineae bacterium]